MAFFDLPLEQLRSYQPPRDEPADFDAFWRRTLDEVEQFPLGAELMPVDYGLRTVETFDLTFRGYGGGRGFPLNWLVWSGAGYANLVMDTRGQGSSSLHGDTPDPEPDGANPHHPGFMTRGVLRPETYYYRRLFTDAVRAVQVAREHPAVDAGRIAVSGGSQGGGIALAVSGLAPEVGVTMADVPFLCHYRRATEITDANPYAEIARYCKAQRDHEDDVFATLPYFDGVNFAARARSWALFLTALMDRICPPSTVFAAYNHFAGPKDIRVWRYNEHEGGGAHQIRDKVRFLQGIWPTE